MKALLLTLVAVATAAYAEDRSHHDHHHDGNSMPLADAQIVVTINPEARVSAVVNAPMPPPIACKETVEIRVKIVNQGSVTAPLRATIVGDGDRHVSLHMEGKKLSGAVEDNRVLHLTPFGSDITDMTVAFSIDNNIGDLGGRDRVHFLVRCLQGQ